MSVILILSGINFILLGIFVVYFEVIVDYGPVIGPSAGILPAILLSFGFALAFSALRRAPFTSRVDMEPCEHDVSIGMQAYPANDNSLVDSGSSIDAPATSKGSPYSARALHHR